MSLGCIGFRVLGLGFAGSGLYGFRVSGLRPLGFSIYCNLLELETAKA